MQASQAFRGAAVRGPLIAKSVAALIAALVLSTARPVEARRSSAATPSSDEPGVARVSFIQGQASYFRADGDDWTGVSVNAPLVTGDRFYSGPDSRSELQLAPGVYARLSSATEL